MYTTTEYGNLIIDGFNKELNNGRAIIELIATTPDYIEIKNCLELKIVRCSQSYKIRIENCPSIITIQAEKCEVLYLCETKITPTIYVSNTCKIEYI